MKHIKLFEAFNNAELYECINSIMDTNLSDVEIDAMLDEGLFSWLKGLFKNPKIKRELDKLAKQLVETRVSIAKIDMEENNIEEFENELEAQDDFDPYSTSTKDKRPGAAMKSYRPSKSGFDDNDPTQIKKQVLKDLETNIIERMDEIGEVEPQLKTYVNKVKLESRIQSTEHIMRMADNDIKRVLSKMVAKDKSTDKELSKELQKQLNTND
jgi:uncharacterized protein YPO0396